MYYVCLFGLRADGYADRDTLPYSHAKCAAHSYPDPYLNISTRSSYPYIYSARRPTRASASDPDCDRHRVRYD